MFITEGRERGIDRRGASVFERGDTIVWNDQHDVAFEVMDRLRKLMIIVPIDRIYNAWPDLVSADGLHFSRDHGFGALLAGYFEILSQQVNTLSDAHTSLAVEAGLDLLLRAIRSKGDDCSSDRGSVLFEGIIRHLEDNLRDPDIGSNGVAAAFGISTRYLQLLFAQNGTTLSDWVRQRRLDRCRMDLETRKSAESITDIALRWGFNDPSHFSRLFRRRYGTAPRAYSELYSF
ncbi:hypothetical protein AS156_18655 [Bradyrhizobium macuxiense]|uniref:HTH araC/xylS-type domain-containing protein n=1 Tax=Bradyrhizobium macuxiense TaxID=1755647 RepID=A0A109JG93_9BRAD|nr:helix-turn-helix transcriptional regulator [Bradyrhizobium macuxiense]KWV48492.1 hypothetical protein AS156_18655 [Bradyrhizobium macuxiense]